MYSPAFCAACTAGGIASCGLAHMAVTPLDLVKCNMQIDPAKYKSISSGLVFILKEQGAKGFFRGWVPTLIGYSGQGACNSDSTSSSRSITQILLDLSMQPSTKLAGSALAEVIADVALCPMEAVKFRV